MATVGDRLHIIIDKLDNSVYALTNTFDDARELLVEAEDGSYTIETWIYENSFRWIYEQYSEYIIQNSVVYKKKYEKESLEEYFAGR